MTIQHCGNRAAHRRFSGFLKEWSQPVTVLQNSSEFSKRHKGDLQLVGLIIALSPKEVEVIHLNDFCKKSHISC
jgi:hypothetical protein